MNGFKATLTTAAVLGALMGTSSLSMAQQDNSCQASILSQGQVKCTPLTAAQQAAAAQHYAQMTQELAGESIQKNQFRGDATKGYGLNITNSTPYDIWVTFYDDTTGGSWGSSNASYTQDGTMCVPPSKSGQFENAYWATNKAQVQVETKTGTNCGGDDYGQNSNAFNSGITVVQGSTTTITVNSVSKKFGDGRDPSPLLTLN